MMILIIIAAVVLDQAAKYLVVTRMAVNQSYPIIKNILHFTYIDKNTGMVFGIFQGGNVILLVMATLFTGLIIWFMMKEKERWTKIALAMVAGGAIGNIIDRIFRGGVVDFIDAQFIDFYIFNVADCFVCVGAGLMILMLLVSENGKDNSKGTSKG